MSTQMRTHRLALLAAGGAAILALASCSAGDSGEAADPTVTPEASASASEPAGKVILWDASDQLNTGAEAYAPVIESFREKYPDVDVEVVDVAEAGAREQFEAASQERTAPTLLVAPTQWTIELASAGLLEPLTDTPLEVALEEYVPPSRATVKFNDRLWGLPQTAYSDALVCNERVLGEADLTAPVTWPDVAAAAEVLRFTGITMMLGPRSGTEALPYLYGEGGAMLDVPGTSILVNSPESDAGWETAVDLVTSGAAPRALPGQTPTIPAPGGTDPAATAPAAPEATDPATPGATASAQPPAPPTVPPTSEADARAAFLAGTLACLVANPPETASLYTDALNTTGVSLSINRMPGGSVDTGAATAQGTAIMVAAAASPADKELGYLFAAHLNAIETQTALAEESVWPPASSTSYSVLSDKSTATAKVFIGFAPALEVAQPWPAIPELPELLPPLDLGWEVMAAGTSPPRRVANDVAAQWRKALPANFGDA